MKGKKKKIKLDESDLFFAILDYVTAQHGEGAYSIVLHYVTGRNGHTTFSATAKKQRR